MKEDFISLDTAILAKSKGFTFRSGNAYYSTRENDMAMCYYPNDKDHYPCSTQALLAKWLREVHNIHLYVEMYGEGHDGWSNLHYEYMLISKLVQQEDCDSTHEYHKSYETALEEGLKEALKLI